MSTSGDLSGYGESFTPSDSTVIDLMTNKIQLCSTDIGQLFCFVIFLDKYSMTESVVKEFSFLCIIAVSLELVAGPNGHWSYEFKSFSGKYHNM